MFKRFTEMISNMGTASLGSGSLKRVRLTNQLAVISLLITVIFIGLLDYWGLNMALYIDLTGLLVYTSVLLFSYINKHRLARWTFIVGLFFHIFALSLSYGESSQIHLLFIPFAAVPLVLIDIRNKTQIIILLFLALTSFILLYLLNFSISSYRIPPDKIIILRFSFILIAAFCQVVIVYSIISNYERSEANLGKSNAILEYQFETMFNNSFDALFLVDWRERRIIKANQRAVEMFEMERPEDFYSTYGLDLHKDPFTLQQTEEMRSQLMTNGYYEKEVLYATKKGNEFWGALAIRLVTIGGRVYQSVRVTDISAKKKNEDLIKNALKEKEILLAEIHHRVKNNLAVISGLIGLQANQVEDEGSRQLFEESRDRIHSMALIHDKLYQHETFAHINYEAYITSLLEHIQNSYHSTETAITYTVTCNNIFLDMQYAVPCGLIMNEMISNANKHAFKGRSKGEIKIVCTKMGGKFTMMVSDDGVGYDMDEYLKNSTSLGITLIQALVDQVGGFMTFKNENGTSYYISFEV